MYQNSPPPTEDWRMVRDRVELGADFLIGFAILAPSFGAGRGRFAVITAGIAGWAVWITLHIGIL